MKKQKITHPFETYFEDSSSDAKLDANRSPPGELFLLNKLASSLYWAALNTSPAKSELGEVVFVKPEPPVADFGTLFTVVTASFEE